MVKKLGLAIVFGIFTIASVPAQDTTKDNTKLRSKYFNLSFVTQKLTMYESLPDLSVNSKWGVAMTFGRTYYLHKKPLAGMIRFGIDATWVDLTYTHYKLGSTFGDGDFEDFGNFGYINSDDIDLDDYESILQKDKYHEAEFSMHVGPSITISPFKALNVNAYFRYAPSFSLIYGDSEFRGNYATFFVTGASVSYGIIGVGAEYRFGFAKYKMFASDNDYYLYDKTKFSAARIYLTFRF